MSFIKRLFGAFTTKKEAPKPTPETKPEPKKTHTEDRPYRHKNTQKPYQNRQRSDRHTHHQRTRHQDTHKETEPKAPEPAPYQGKPFAELGLDATLVQKLKDLGFTHSTQVQETSIPETLQGKNIFCSSETGSGKTLSFLLPMIHHFYENKINQALILCPTREIAIQIQKTLITVTDDRLSSALVIGGTNIEMQKKELRKYPQILVATPGRLIDMLSTGLIWLEHTGYVVLDEADRMLDMGFEEDLILIHKELTGPHQTVLFSATLFPEIKKMANRYADDYKEIVIGNPTHVATTITHVLIQVDPEEKLEALRYLISQNPGKMIVFFNTIRETISMTGKMSRVRGARVGAIHSKIDQAARERTIENFKNGAVNVLMASDVVSRGIDIPNVDLVVNFDIPNYSEEYIHRVGRSGRSGNKGMAITLHSAKDKRKVAAVEKLIKGKIERRDHYRDVLRRSR